MSFDIKKRLLVCEHCEYEIAVEDYKRDNSANYQKNGYEVNTFVCKECGAELTSLEEESSTYCPYCGNQATLHEKSKQEEMPVSIIPFCITKEEAKDAYNEMIAKQWFVPKEYKDDTHLQEFRGIYLPFHNFVFEIKNKKLKLNGERNYTKGSYDYHETYDVFTDLEGDVDDVVFDASANFDDTISSAIAPFNNCDLTEFNEGYLAGFYSDKVTASSELYEQHAEDIAAKSLSDKINNSAGDVVVKFPYSDKGKSELFGLSQKRKSISLFPIWFLTYRNNDRVAYSVVNGQTGKITMDTPVDKKSFFRAAGIGALIVFIIFTLFFSSILPKTVLAISAILTVISSIILSREVKTIKQKECHAFDIGNTDKTKKKKIKNILPKNKNVIVNTPAKAILAFFSLVFLIPLFSFISSNPLLALFVSLILLFICLFKNIKNCIQLKKKSAILSTIFSIIAIFVSFAIMLWSPPADAWYYGCAIACLVSMISNSLSSINYFNFLTTRPVPNFFERTGANNGI